MAKACVINSITINSTGSVNAAGWLAACRAVTVIWQSCRYLIDLSGKQLVYYDCCCVRDGDWWLARSLLTGDEGYIPSTYVAPYSGLQSYDWFHGHISKKDVDKLLKQPANTRGTFLVRDSERMPGTVHPPRS